ncbi:MAG: Transcriptional regulator, LysR family [uncultured Paraburkholderia sp.]|nr:MAG: Transcriptional regulator, LysR family [uncultured Paraburkholderia sp.]CAH2923820.1 MAG: Transcriptional regulator, LysR family [uncultured Paraburkholderia sp.]
MVECVGSDKTSKIAMAREDDLNNQAALPELLRGIATFARVAHHGSFRRAAAELGVSTSALSRRCERLKSDSGRVCSNARRAKVGLMEIGDRFLQDAQPALDGVQELRDQPAGLLRLNVSRIAADIVVMPYLVEFLETYPELSDLAGRLLFRDRHRNLRRHFRRLSETDRL